MASEAEEGWSRGPETCFLTLPNPPLRLVELTRAGVRSRTRVGRTRETREPPSSSQKARRSWDFPG
eukprot:1978917-Prymnesium_polylepis.1